MSRRLPFAFFLAVAFLPGGCGVHVGNGLRGPGDTQRFQSGEGYAVQYSPRLTLTEQGSNVGIDNRNLLAADESTRLSRVSIVVESAPGTGRTAEDLSRYVKGRDRYGRYETRDMSGAFAMVNQVSDGPNFRAATYYFLIKSSGKILKGTMTARREGQGIELIVPLLDTFEGL